MPVNCLSVSGLKENEFVENVMYSWENANISNVSHKQKFSF